MATATRIYHVTSLLKGYDRRLIRATSQAQAVRHAAGKVFKAEVASQDDIVRAMQGGATVEIAGDDNQEGTGS